MEERLAKHALMLPEMIFLVVRRLDLQEIFLWCYCPEGVVRDGSDEPSVLDSIVSTGRQKSVRGFMPSCTGYSSLFIKLVRM